MEYYWYDIAKSDYLSVSTMNDIYRDCEWISNKIGENVSFSEVNVWYNENPRNIFLKFVDTNANIRKIDGYLDFINPYMFESYPWDTARTINKKEVHNWIDYLNYCHDVFSGTEQGFQYLVDANGFDIVDKRGNNIVVYKG